MLPSTVENFGEPMWVKAPEVNGEGNVVAELKLLPYTYDDLCDVYEKFGICKQCDGTRVVRGSLCHVCKDKPDVRQSDPQVRHYLVKKHLVEWKLVLVKNPLTGEVTDLPFSERARDGWAKVLSAFVIVLKRATELGAVQDDRKKDSTIPPDIGSGMESTPPVG